MRRNEAKRNEAKGRLSSSVIKQVSVKQDSQESLSQDAISYQQYLKRYYLELRRQYMLGARFEEMDDFVEELKALVRVETQKPARIVVNG